MKRYLEIKIPEMTAPESETLEDMELKSTVRDSQDAQLKHFESQIKTVGFYLRHQAGLTRKQISQAKFRPDGILKNGVRCRVTEEVKPGEVIAICLEEEHTDSAQLKENSLETEPLQILYEDADLLAVNKRAGLVTHPSGVHYQDSLANQVAVYFRQKGESTRVRSIGRLDKDTSGILLFARNQTAAARLQRQREEGKLCKRYLALTAGKFGEYGEEKRYCTWEENPKCYTISRPIMQDPLDRLKMTVADGNVWGNPGFEGYRLESKSLAECKSAVTHFRILENRDASSLLELWLETGRTHQIRVHLSSIGHPLLGDQLYNPQWEKSSFKRAALHAWRLVFDHPFTGEKIALEAPLPDDFKAFWSEKI